MKYVLFVCNHNAGRSQIARAFFERLAPADVRAESAGSTPAKQIWPSVIGVMREVGIDISQLLPGLAAEFEGSHSREEIRACADAVLSEFDGVPVRRFVIPIAQKRVRSCLRAEECVPTAP